MEVGSTIGQYRLLRKIGEGGMGVVFVGEHVLIRRRAAIKVLKPEISKRRGTIERFFNEARATAAIQDPGIAQLFDVGVDRDRAYIVMELLDGESLHTRLRRTGSLAAPDALRLVRQIASTLAVVHAAGIVHRDLKPANLFSVADPTAPGGERIKILDFGVAKLGPELHDGAQTRAGAIMGTPIYMSPEQCSGTVIDQRADIYSLGCVLFRLVTGRPPFAVQGEGQVIAAHLTEPPPPPSRFVAQLPPGLDELVLRCLAKPREDRFPTMAELGDACDRLLAAWSGQQLAAPAPPPPEPATVALDPPTTLDAAIGERPRSAAPRRKWIGAAVAVGVFAASIVAVAVAWGGDDDRTAAPAPHAARAEVAMPLEAPASGVVAIDAATVAAEPATEAAAPSVAEPAAKPKPAAAKPAAAKPAATKPPSKPRSAEPRDDLYDDRN